MKSEKINLIFDCDGTLIDSYEGIADVVVRIFRRYNVEVNKEEVKKRSLFTTLDNCIYEIAEQHGIDTDEAIAAFDDFPENRDLITLIGHPEEILSSGDYNCFVYTHRGSSCREIFERLGVLKYFIEVVDDTYKLKKKPDGEGIEYIVEKHGLDKGRTYYIGDRKIDMECGKNAGVGTIFLKCTDLDIDCSKADYIITDFPEINNLPL